MNNETGAEFVKRLKSNIKAYSDTFEALKIRKAIIDAIKLDLQTACDRLEQADVEKNEWGKKQEFHYCVDNIIRPLPEVFCSLCRPQKDSRNFNAFDKIEQQQKCIVQIVTILKSPMGFAPEDAPAAEEIAAILESKISRAIAKAEELLK